MKKTVFALYFIFTACQIISQECSCISLDSDSPQFWIQLIDQANSQGKHKEAYKLLESASLLFPQDETIVALNRQFAPPPEEPKTPVLSTTEELTPQQLDDISPQIAHILEAEAGKDKTPQERLLNSIANYRRVHNYQVAARLLEEYKQKYGSDYLYEEQFILLDRMSGGEQVAAGKVLLEAAAAQRHLHNYPVALTLLLEYKRKFGPDSYLFQEESILLSTVSVTKDNIITCDPVQAYELASWYTMMGGKPWFGKSLDYASIAVAYDSCNVDYLFLKATAAQGAAEFIKAELIYRNILTIDPCHVESMHNLARVLYAQGRADEAAWTFRYYWAFLGHNRESLLDFAQALTTQSRFWNSLSVLECYRRLFGEDERYLERRARYLAWAGRPTAAMCIVDPILAVNPCDFEALVTYAIAAIRLRYPEKALCALKRLELMNPDRLEVFDIQNVFYTPYRPYFIEDFYFYHDTTSLTQFLNSNVIALPRLRTKYLAGVDFFATWADGESGLDQRNGINWANANYVWAGAEHLFCNRVLAGFRGGRAYTNAQDSMAIPAYDLFFNYRISDCLEVQLDSHYNFYLISPRALSLYIRRWANELIFEWRPTLRCRLTSVFDFDCFTDSNKRWNVELLPRTIVKRTENILWEAGFATKQMAYRKEFNNGYYDPNYYQRYVLTSYFYYYFDQQNGIDTTIFLGVEKATRRKLSHYFSAVTHLFLGLYEGLYFQLKGKITSSQSTLGGGDVIETNERQQFFAVEAEAILNYRY